MEDDILSGIEPATDRKEALGMRYQIGGSVASSVYVVARSTVDVDMLTSLPTDLVGPRVEGLRQIPFTLNRRTESVSRANI